ncbi:MAG: hypothetical protein ABJ387_03600 [Balneola sp.]
MKKDFDTYTEEERQEHLKALEDHRKLIESGYAGLNKNCHTVDRREFPEAVPYEENRLLGIPKPKEVKS